MESQPPKEELLNKSIEKCEKVLKYHPKSKYVPDAIFLMGKCFLAKGDYSEATQKFQELMAYYPKHRLADESRLFLGKAYISENSYSEARDILAKVEKNQEEAYKLIVDSYFLAGNYETAIETGNEFIDNFSRSKFKFDVLMKIGAAYDSLEMFTSAIETYQQVLKLTTERFTISFAIANDLLVLGNAEEALQEFMKLRSYADEKEKEALELKTAACYRNLNKPEEAITILEALENSAAAKFEIGLIYEEDLSDLEKAYQYYEEARLFGGDSKIAQQALFRASRIGKLTEYREKVQDSTQVAALAETQFLLAELYFSEFEKIDEAIEEYEKIIQNFPESEYAPKAAYAIAWIYEHKKENIDKALEAYERITVEFPETQHAESAARAILRLKNESNPE